MTGARARAGSAVAWLTAQSLLFGAMAAFLGVVANAMFLEAYGSGWLPATYIAIGVAGVALSGLLARATQRFDLLQLAVGILGSAGVVFLGAWLVAIAPGGAWVSVPLLVLFPILLQLGFVFIGGQAGRVLDIAGIKSSFPRIMTGFPVGAVIGGLLGVPLVDLTGRSEDLLLATAAAEAGFAALVWATGRRYASALVLAPQAPAGQGPAGQGGAHEAARVDTSLRGLLRSPFVMLILAYQVLSALGSQLSDFLVFDRAGAAFADAEELARFVSGYTAVMNAVSIAFLYLVAGPLLRRFGLRLGIAANPLVVTFFAAAMVIALAMAGGASTVLLAVVAGARIADIALTDGTTRTSINALYQVLPPRPRIATQAAVEGMGVPVAIGLSGVLILALNAIPEALAATIVALGVVCAVWTWIGLRLYAAYGPALADALRRAPLLDPDAAFVASVDDAAIARRLIVSSDPRAARLGLELTGMLTGPGPLPELATLAGDQRPDVRLAALAAMAESGDEVGRGRLASEVRTAARSIDPAVRAAAARASAALAASDRTVVVDLLDDRAPEVRSAALDAVRAGEEGVIAAATEALEDPRTAAAAMSAVGRLGEAVLPMLEARRVERPGAATPSTKRLLRAVAVATPTLREAVLRYVGHRDRHLGLLALERLAGPGPAVGGADVLDGAVRDDVAHAARVLCAIVALEGDATPPQPGDPDRPLLDALGDELDLDRARLVAAWTARHGRDRFGPALTGLRASGDGAALANEALEVILGQALARPARALLAPGIRSHERLQELAAAGAAMPSTRGRGEWLRDLVEDPEDLWRSAWLRACAIRAARLRGLLDRFDLASATIARDPVVEEELRLAGSQLG